jgi:hypothetical protein
MSLTIWCISYPVTSHSVYSIASCCQITCHCSGVLRVINRTDATLQPHCYRLPARLAGIKYTVCLARLTCSCLRPTDHREPHDAWQRRSPTGREVGSGAIRHVAHKPSTVERWGPEPWYMWRRWSPSSQGGGVRSRWTRGNPGAHIGWEARSNTVGHVTARECMPRSLS